MLLAQEFNHHCEFGRCCKGQSASAQTKKKGLQNTLFKQSDPTKINWSVFKLSDQIMMPES
jgi:hypothetical protein